MTADTLTEKGSIVCLICNASVGVSTRNSCPIFQYNVTSSEQPVANILSVILGQEIRKELVHSEIICKKCFKLCNEVDELQERLTEIKMELNNYYQRTVRKVEGGQDDDMDSNSPQVFMYPRAKTVKSTSGPPRRPGRPRKNPEIHPGVPKYQPDENGTLEIDETIIADDDDDDDEEDEDDRGIGLDDENDLDYVPNASALNKKSGESFRKVHQALLAASGQAEGDVQIKLEVIDEGEEEHILDRDGLPKKKSLVKRKEPDVPNVIPRMIVSREGKTYTCLLCSADEKVQGDAKSITLHMRDSHNIRLYICDMCGMEFLKRSELSNHFDQHVATEEGDFHCDVCNRIFTNLRLFRVHKRMHLPQPKNHICEICGKGFLSRNTLDEHMNIHTGSRPYKCNDCGKDFASKYSARAHEKTHTERPRPYKCHQCSKSFITEQNLIQHERTHVAVRSFSCQVCGKSFSSGRNLEVHCVVHTGYKPFICRMCGKAFARKAEIRDHERTHTGEKPYQCEFCGATFGQRSNLQSHKRATHYDDKRYQCVECGKAFKRRRLLDYHIKAAHTGERPYKCQICSATFIYPEHFKKHRRIHTGEKPYQCEVCGKAFNSRDNRNAHRFVHSDKKPYECLVCGVGFMRKPQLYNHMQAQGHVNDTIVVNQPRLTTDDDLLAQQAEEGLAAVMGEHQTKWQTEEEQETETKVYISELKEHVIIQQGKNEDVGEEGHYTEEVGHLIIDGPVHFADGDTLELATTDGGATLAEGMEGAHHVVVPAGTTLRAAQPGAEYTVEAAEGTTTMQTANGQVHLVQITLPESSESHTAWFNIVEQ